MKTLNLFKKYLFHYIVNNSKHFIDPVTAYNTQKIECL